VGMIRRTFDQSAVPNCQTFSFPV